MQKENMDLRCAAWAVGIPLWAVADEMGVSTDTLYRLLRKPLDAAQRKQFELAIEKLKETCA